MLNLTLLDLFIDEWTNNKAVGKPFGNQERDEMARILVTLDSLNSLSLYTNYFGEDRLDQWMIPNWLVPCVKPRKVTIMANDMLVPNLSQGNDTFNGIEPYKCSADFNMAALKMVKYMKRLPGPMQAFSELSKEVILTDILNRVGYVIIRSKGFDSEGKELVEEDWFVSESWDGNIPVYVPLSKDIYGEDILSRKASPKVVFNKILNILYGSTTI